MKTVIFTICITLLSIVMLGSNSSSQPNILLIVADDMNGYGFNNSNPQVISPNLDQFKETAISFPNTYCAAPACSPSRTAFLGGISPHKTGKYYNGGTAWNDILTAKENMMEYLQRVGYDTYGKGKIYHSEISEERKKVNFIGSLGKGGFGPFPDKENQIGGSRFRGMQAFPDSDFPDVQNADAIIELLQSNHEKPFFMMYGLWRPHSPYTCPQRFYDMYNLEDITIPPGYLKDDSEDLPEIAQAYIETKRKDFEEITSSEQQYKEYLRGYYACYTFADYNIGCVLDALDNSKYADNTIVIITSDNGFHMGEKNRFDKNSCWELSAITPMAIRVPDSKLKGQTCTKPVNLQDLYPTFVDLCGQGEPPLNEIDGRSIKPLLENPKSDWEYPSITYFGENWVSLRNENYRYISYPDGSEELYDHRTDPWEWNNLADDSELIEIREFFKPFIPQDQVEPINGKWTLKMKGIEDKIKENRNIK